MITPRYDLWTAKTTHRTQTRYIVIHHAGASYQPGDAVRAIYAYHRQRWPDYGAAGYHIIIQRETDGTLGSYLVNCPYQQGAGVAQRNHETFHICLADNFASSLPSDDWIVATKQAIAFAKELFPNAEVVGHRDIALPQHPTICPGGQWNYWKTLLGVSSHAAITPDTPIVGAVRDLSAKLNVIGKIAARTTQYTLQDVIAIVDGYIATCSRATMDWIIPIAQMCHETGYLTSFWSQRPQRNPAGIGVTGEHRDTKPETMDGWAYNTQRKRWERGLSFPAWVTHSIPAHVGRLLAYALRDDEANEAQKELIAYAVSVRPLPNELRGSCKRIRDLAGTWAVPGTGYPDAICSVARVLLAE